MKGSFFRRDCSFTGRSCSFTDPLYAGKKRSGQEELLDVFYGNGEYANPSGSLRAGSFQGCADY